MSYLTVFRAAAMAAFLVLTVAFVAVMISHAAGAFYRLIFKWRARHGGKKIHLYLDMDGCLAKWQDVSLDRLYEKDYFRNLPPDKKLLVVAELVQDTFKDSLTEKICSHFLEGTDADVQKRGWLDQFAGFIKSEDIVFVPYSHDKDSYVVNDGSVINVLIDDYSENLRKWEAAGNVGIKYMNGINGTKGTWSGLRLDGRKEFESMYLSLVKMLLGVMKGGNNNG